MCEIGTCGGISAQLHTVQKLAQLSPSVAGQFQQKRHVSILADVSNTKQLHISTESCIGLRKVGMFLHVCKITAACVSFIITHPLKIPLSGSWLLN